MYIPSSRTEVSEPHSFLWRQVHYNEAIDTCVLGIFNHPLLAITENRIVVAHEEYGRL